MRREAAIAGNTIHNTEAVRLTRIGMWQTSSAERVVAIRWQVAAIMRDKIKVEAVSKQGWPIEVRAETWSERGHPTGPHPGIAKAREIARRRAPVIGAQIGEAETE